MIKRIFVLLLVAVLSLSLLCACSAPQGADAYDGEKAAALRGKDHRYLTVWSWQIPNADTARLYAERAVAAGFTAIDLGLLWAHFEPLKGHFDWSYLDAVMEEFTRFGLGVSLQPILWTKDLEWSDRLALQQSPEGVLAQEGKGAPISLSDAETRATVKNTLQNFALHASTNYGEKLTRWGIRLSPFGEFDYPVNAECDYSSASEAAFRSYLKEHFGSGLGEITREQIDTLPLEELVDGLPVQWRAFRTRTLLDFADLCYGILETADETVPTVCNIGSFGNGMNTLFSGFADPYSLACDRFDSLSVALCEEVDASLVLSLLGSVFDGDLCVEVDGASVWDEGDKDRISAQLATAARYGIQTVSTANYTEQQLLDEREFLLTFETVLSASETVAAADPTKAIVLFAHAPSLGTNAENYTVWFGEIFALLSENGTRRVRFLTDGQIAARESTLEGVTDLYAGALEGKVTAQKGFEKVFAESEFVLHTKAEISAADGSALADPDRIVAE